SIFCCISNCLSSSRLNTTSRFGFSRSRAVAMNRLPNEPVPPVTRTDFPFSEYMAAANCLHVVGESRRELLQLAHPVEMATLAPGQLVEPAVFDDLAVGEHVDPIAAADRRQPVRDDHDRHLALELVDALLDRELGLRVERT